MSNHDDNNNNTTTTTTMTREDASLVTDDNDGRQPSTSSSTTTTTTTPSSLSSLRNGDGGSDGDGNSSNSSRRSSHRRTQSRTSSSNSTGGGALSDSGDSQDFGPAGGGAPSLRHCLYGILPNDDNDDDDDNTEAENIKPCPTAPHHVIHLKYLRKLASRGIAEEGSHRATAWRVLLGYLPAESDDWTETLQTNRDFYKSCVADLFADVYDAQHGDALRWRPRPRPVPQRKTSLVDNADASSQDGDNDDDDDDANNNNNNKGNDKDSETSSSSREDDVTRPVVVVEPSPLARPPPITPTLSDAIRQAWKSRGKDEHLLNNLSGTYNALNVPEKAQDMACASDEEEERNHAVNTYVESTVLLDEIRKDVVRTHPDLAFFLQPNHDLGKRRYHAIERILFVWATYNKGVRYVQGMNEIVGAIYYVLAKDWKPQWAAEAEADTYYLFSTLLAEMRDVFMSEMDNEDSGIKGRLSHMQKLLKLHDPEVQEHLQEVGVDVSYYAVRWWTTLLSREFLLPDTIRLWDSMFASTHKDNFMRYVCVTMVLVIRDKLLKGDFSTCIKLLQGYPPTHMDHLIEASRALWVYETQVTLAIHKGGFTRHLALQTISPPPAIIMAFGFRQGLVTTSTRAENLQQAGGKAADRVRDVSSKMATSARTYLDKANGLFNKVLQQTATTVAAQRNRTASTDHSATTTTRRDSGGGDDEEEEVIRFSEDKLKTFEDDTYMAHFMDD